MQEGCGEEYSGEASSEFIETSQAVLSFVEGNKLSCIQTGDLDPGKVEVCKGQGLDKKIGRGFQEKGLVFGLGKSPCGRDIVNAITLAHEAHVFEKACFLAFALA